MQLDLSSIIEVPGGVVPFSCDLDTDQFDFPFVEGFCAPPHASGIVKNSAGALNLSGTLEIAFNCICDRCGKEFVFHKTQTIDVPLADQLEDAENADIFLLEGDCLNLSEVLSTCLILEMESKFLCTEDCAGLCQQCGANLNEGDCRCKAPIDPRLAALGQLLDNIDE